VKTKAAPAETPRALGYRMPAEWEPHEAIWLSWPYDPESFAEGLPQTELAYVHLIREIHKTERVELLVTGEPMERKVQGMLDRAGIDLRRVRLHRFDYADVWFRDYGPTFVRGKDKNLAMIRWVFNAWGGKYEDLKRDTKVPDLLRDLLKLRTFEPGIVMEGGSIEVNGKGTVLTTEQCLLNKNRNPKLNRTQIEEKLRENLGVEQVLWLKDGIAGDDTDGHIDDIARFSGPRTLVCAVEESQADDNWEPLQDALQALSRMKDQDGKPFDVVPLPMPERVEGGGRRLPASYANFYIGNGVVLVPVFRCPQDEKALNTLEPLFPGRRLAPIPCRELVRGLGTLHCISQQQPK